MPVQTRSEKRPADKAPETDDSVNKKKPASGIHGSAQASAKKKGQQLRWKSTERRRASPKKQAAVRAQDAAQHQARWANLPDEDRDAVRAQNAAQHVARVAAMSPAEQQAFHAREAEREAQRVAKLPEDQRVTRGMAKQQADARRWANLSEEERAAVRAQNAAQHAARVAAMSPAEQQAFHALKVARETQRVAELPEDRRVTRQMTRQQAAQKESRRATHQHSDARRREAAAQAPEAVNEAIRQGKPTCDINQHLEYCTQGGSTPGRHGVQDILDEMAEYSTTFEERWEQAKQYETKMRERMYDTRPCACCGIRVPETTM